MRRVLLVAVLFSVLVLTAGLSPLSATTCTTSCSGGVSLSCTPVVSCSSVSGQSITCDGQQVTCSAAGAWCSCQRECIDETCANACEFSPGACGFCLNNCYENNCSPTPFTQCPGI